MHETRRIGTRWTRTSLASGIVSLTVVLSANGAYVFNGSNFPLTETFDGLPTVSMSGVFSNVVGTQSAIDNTGFVGTKLAGTGGSPTALIADNGAGTSGGIYSYGAPSVGERALGMLASGTNIMGFGFELQNTSGTTITTLMISLTQENWRSSTTTMNVMNASFGTTDTLVLASNFVSAATGFTDVDSLDLTGPAPVTTNGALDGNDPLNQAARSFTFTGLDVGPGESFFLRWQDANDTGNDAGIALDGLVINVPEPTAGVAALGGFGLLTGLLRRRRQ